MSSSSKPTRYGDLDRAIVDHIQSGRAVHPIYCDALLRIARAALEAQADCSDDKQWRLIDRRLGALKRRGVIHFDRGTRFWRLVQASLVEDIGELLEYAERFADLNDEPEGGDCRESIRKANAWLETGSATLDGNSIAKTLEEYVERFAGLNGEPRYGACDRLLQRRRSIGK